MLFSERKRVHITLQPLIAVKSRSAYNTARYHRGVSFQPTTTNDMSKYGMSGSRPEKTERRSASMQQRAHKTDTRIARDGTVKKNDV